MNIRESDNPVHTIIDTHTHNTHMQAHTLTSSHPSLICFRRTIKDKLFKGRGLKF